MDGVVLRFSFGIGFQRLLESFFDARVDVFVLVVGTRCRQPQASVEPHRFGAAERLRSVSLFALDGAASACAREQAWQNSWSSSSKNIAPHARRSESASSQGRLRGLCRRLAAAEGRGSLKRGNGRLPSWLDSVRVNYASMSLIRPLTHIRLAEDLPSLAVLP